MTLRRALVVFGAAAALARPAAAQEAETSYWDRARRAVQQLSQSALLEEIQRVYQQARDAGENVPTDLLAWVREDLDRHGRWEYRVLGLRGAGLEAALNAAGRERWECVAVTQGESGGYTVFLKRPVVSRLRQYFGQVAVADLMKAFPEAR